MDDSIMDDHFDWRFKHHQFSAVCGERSFAPSSQSIVPFNLQVQTESNANQDPTALALQIQSLTATVEELTRQNQEMRQRLQQEDNLSNTNQDDDGESHRRQLGTPEGASSDLLKEMRKEMDELRNAIKGKTDQSLDKMVMKTNSPFTLAV